MKNDARLIQAVMSKDEASAVLSDVDARVDEERPYLAAQLLEASALPVANAQLTRARTLRVTTTWGTEQLSRLIKAYQDRVAALVEYDRVLNSGAKDDRAVLHALTTQHAAQKALVAVATELERVRPLTASAR